MNTEDMWDTHSMTGVNKTMNQFQFPAAVRAGSLSATVQVRTPDRYEKQCTILILVVSSQTGDIITLLLS